MSKALRVGRATSAVVGLAVLDSGGLQLVDDQLLRPFRCVYQPLKPG